MNKHISLKRAAFVAVALGTLGATAVYAQTVPATTTTTTTTTGTQTPGYGEGWHHHRHHMSVLTPTERAELRSDFQKVFASDPALKTQKENLHQQFEALKSQSTPATQAQWEALKQQREAFHTQLRAAVEGVDSGAAALFQKIEAAHSQHQSAN
jgi:hypothetical protein